jgi:hypothetical protein
LMVERRETPYHHITTSLAIRAFVLVVPSC